MEMGQPRRAAAKLVCHAARWQQTPGWASPTARCAAFTGFNRRGEWAVVNGK